jgi:hypothetical protein
VWIFGGSLGPISHGAIAERTPVGDAHMVEVPEGADAALAAGLGIAGLARSPPPCSSPAACGR